MNGTALKFLSIHVKIKREISIFIFYKSNVRDAKINRGQYWGLKENRNEN